jgi:hypothetical protein
VFMGRFRRGVLVGGRSEVAPLAPAAGAAFSIVPLLFAVL